jgi:energy-coupling factor transporter ATP-binding protein EcfA2
LQHDFGSVVSESQKRALSLCRSRVRSGAIADGEALWNLLRGIAAELRPVAGSITLQQLVERIRHRIALADYPYHESDWRRLGERSRRDAGQVADAIAGRIRIPRDAGVDALENALKANDLVALLGTSGSGKSAVSKALMELRSAASEETIWLDARSLDRSDFWGFESLLGLQHPLDELLASAVSPRPVIILDGLDRLYSDNAFRNVATLLRLARQDAPGTRWIILAPCQNQEWPRVLEAIQRAGSVGGTWTQIQLESLTVAQLKPVGDEIPALARLLLQPKVGTLLTNLKLLDLVARRVDAGTDVNSTNWVGELSVADWFWTAEIDRGVDRIARGRFVRELAQRQADELVASVSTDDFEMSELAPLESLAADQLCVQVPGDRIAFAHDLYGDWARLRILLNHRSNLPGFFRQRKDSPLWHRALRLFGIHQLEHSGGAEDWRAVLVALEPDEFGILQDVMLEAPVFAANARTLLDAVLPDLLADNGRFLRRMLTRFLAFATVPNSAMVALAVAVGMERSEARATYRRPYWPLWIDVLEFLHEHRTLIVPSAPREVARVVEMWLEFAPIGSARRTEAAELAVLLGQHALATRDSYGGRQWDDERKRFYKCALAAANERTDEVIAIALNASERQSGTGEANVAHDTGRRKRRGRVSGGSNTVRGPWPDGPRARVDEAFQSVVLDSTAILGLFRVRPEAAREVLLANLIQEPKEEDWNDHWMDETNLGIVNRHKWLPALYTQGPFLACLLENFAEGLEIIARLVEFAAARNEEQMWHESRESRARAIAEDHAQEQTGHLVDEALSRQVVILDGERTRILAGDGYVYGWSAGLGNPPDAIESALMALEQYFYLRLDEENDIKGEIATVLARCESVALLGVLCDVGKREMSLFEGPMQTLLSAPELYSWEISKLVHGRSHLMIGAFTKGEWFMNLARQFHGLEHRTRDLRQVAISLMIQRPAMREYFDRVRAAWSAVTPQNAGIFELQQQLAVALDFTNYELREDPEHGRVLVNVEAVKIHEARADERRAMEDQMLLSTLPTRFRAILDERQQLDETRLTALWDQWERVRTLATSETDLPHAEQTFGDELANAIAGGVAVFLWHADWCANDTARQVKLIDALRAIWHNPPEQREFNSDHSVSTWTYDCFIAEAAAMLWSRSPLNEEWRRLVAETVFSQKYAVVRILFARCAESRCTLGEDFNRLRRLAVEWAHVRAQVNLLRRVPQENLQPTEDVLKRVSQGLQTWREDRLNAFVSTTLPGVVGDWKECADVCLFPDLEHIRRKWPGSPALDFHLVRCSHEWLPLPNDAQDEREREEVIRFWRTALDVVLARPVAVLKRRHHQHPQKDERWVLENVGAAILQMHSSEQPELLWHPVVDLHSEGHDWPEALAHAIHRHALAATRMPAAYINIVRSMLQRAFTAVEGRHRWSSHERVWDALIGIDWYTRDLWDESHLIIVRELKDAFLFWMTQAPVDGHRLAGFATWLARSAATPVRFEALVWMAQLVHGEDAPSPYDVAEAADAIASLLNIVWAEQEGALRGDESAFQAFRSLLGWLGVRQNKLGLELIGRLGGLS